MTAVPAETTADFEALLANVFENPDDNLARLVFADYVEEQGDTDRAEFIRLQIETARKGEKYPGKRESELMATLFGNRLKFGRDRFEPHRGFLTLKSAGELSVLGPKVPPGVALLFRAGWVDRVAVLGNEMPFDAATVSLLRDAGCLDLSRNRFPPVYLGTIAKDVLPQLAGGRVRRVLVHRTNADDWAEIVADPDAYLANDSVGTTRYYDYVTTAQFAVAVRRDRFVGATEVLFRGSLSAEVCRLFADSPTVAGVNTLGIHSLGIPSLADPLGADQVASIVRSPHLTNVAKFTASGCAIGPQVSALLLESNFLRRLVDLELTDCSLADGDLERLIVGAPFPRLRSLLLWGNLVTAETVHRLCASGRFPKLASLTVPNIPGAGTNWLRLALLSRQPALAVTAGGVCYESVVNPGGLRLVVTRQSGSTPFEWPDAAGELDWSRYSGISLHGAPPDARTLRQLVTTFRAARLTCLGIKCHNLSDSDLTVLAENLPEFRVQRLDLSQSHLDTAQVGILLNALDAAKLKHLDLSGNPTPRTLLDLLANSQAVRALETLTLRAMPSISSAAVKEFAKRLPNSVRVEW